MSEQWGSAAGDPLGAMEAMAGFVEYAVGMRAQLMREGFSQEQAGDLVVVVLRQALTPKV